MKFTKKDYQYLVQKYDDLMVLQVKLLDWEEENMIGDCTPSIKRIERVRNDLIKIMRKVKGGIT